MLKFYSLLIAIVFSVSAIGQTSFEYASTDLELNEEYGITDFGGGGVTFFDFDQDGLDDITMPTSTGDSIHFYKNMGGYFEKIQPSFVSNTEMVKCVSWADYDNDNDYDLVVTEIDHGCFLYENQGDMTFVDVSASAGITDEMSAFQSATWGDIDNDGNLDLYLTTNDNATFLPNFLYKSNGDGTFEDISTSAGVKDSIRSPFQMVFSDLDLDGDQDMYFAIDHNGGNTVFINNGDDSFTETTESSGGGLELFSMCITAGDFDNDGDEDFYFTNMLPDGSLLALSNGDATFTEEAETVGLNWLSDGWGSSWLDADLDGDLDLFTVGCHNGLDGFESSAFYDNNGDGTFTKLLDIGFENDTMRSYGTAVGDYDNDGYPDILVNNENGYKLTMWHNTTVNNNHYLKVHLIGVTNNRDGIGSWIEVYNDGEKQSRYTHNTNGYLSQNSQYEIFGLGTNESADSVKVIWLNGMVDVAYDVAADQKVTFTEGEGATGIVEYSEALFKLYPNPSRGLLTLEIPNEIQNVTSIKFISVDGRIAKEIRLDSKTQNLNINTSDLPSGMYVLILQTPDKAYSEQIVIENR